MTTPALLVMDVQTGIVERVAEHAEPLLATLAESVAATRDARIPVVYVRVAFREGAPEVSPKNQVFSTHAGSGALSETSPATQIHPAVAPRSGDIIVTKRRVSAFCGSDLDVVLRSLDVDALVLAGIATERRRAVHVAPGRRPGLRAHRLARRLRGRRRLGPSGPHGQGLPHARPPWLSAGAWVEHTRGRGSPGPVP